MTILRKFMKKIYLFIFCFLLSISSQAQDTSGGTFGTSGTLLGDATDLLFFLGGSRDSANGFINLTKEEFHRLAFKLCGEHSLNAYEIGRESQICISNRV